MDYRVVMMEDAVEDLDRFIAYLLYFMLYRIKEDIVFVDNIFHELQDYENAMS